MHIMHFRKFYVPMSTGLLEDDKSLKMPLDSILEGVLFQHFLGEHAPRTPIVLVCFACTCDSHTMTVHIVTSPTSIIVSNVVMPPPLFNSLILPLLETTILVCMSMHLAAGHVFLFRIPIVQWLLFCSSSC